MKIGDIEATYIGHVCFQFKSPGGTVLITDPFFADGFEWQGHWERYLSPPAVELADIKVCDVIFVSHEHGDHFDRDAIRAILRQTSAVVLAPACVLEALEEDDVAKDRLVLAQDGKRFEFGDLSVETFGGYDNGFDARGRMDKFAAVIGSGDTSLFYSGDCHELPQGVRGRHVDAMFCWPELVDEKLAALCSGLGAERFVLMHCDRFDPGLFLCNLDLDEQRDRVARLAPGMEVVVPERAQRLL